MGALPVVAICNLLAKPNNLKSMKKPTKKQTIESNAIISRMLITNPSCFMPKPEVDGVRFPCVACRNLDTWTDDECRIKCLHYPR
jgi:hypothetical protein